MEEAKIHKAPLYHAEVKEYVQFQNHLCKQYIFYSHHFPAYAISEQVQHNIIFMSSCIEEREERKSVGLQVFGLGRKRIANRTAAIQ